MWRTAIATDSYRAASEDRAAVLGSFVVVADGVGGRAGGGAAADAVVDAVRELADQPPHPWDRVQWMTELDRRMTESGTVGETTAVVVNLTTLGPIGVAVGDSVAWWVRDDDWGELTTAAKPKPWVGSGGAVSTTFLKPLQYVGTLLLATDGLTKYSSAERIVNVIRTTRFESTPRALIELVRPPTGSGRLPDDVAVIVARCEPHFTR